MRNGKHETSQEFLSQLDEMKLSLEHPFVLVCSEGTTSYSLATQMVEKGFKNVYCIKGGWKSLAHI